MSKKAFDWNTLPKIEYMGILIKFDRDIEEFFKFDMDLVEVKKRAMASRMFFAQAVKITDPLIIGAYIRAGLNEFVSMEGAARIDWKKLFNHQKPPFLKDSENPLVYVMYWLRNINVHARCIKTRSDQAIVTWNDPKDLRDFEINIDVLDLDFKEQLLNSRDVKKFFEIDDLQRICRWIEDKQTIFGVGHLFSKGLNFYCRELIEAYNKLMQPTANASAD